MPLPGRDDEGRKVMLVKTGEWDMCIIMLFYNINDINEVRACPSIDSFRKKLKAYLFSKTYPP